MKSTSLFAIFLLCAFTSYLPSATAQDVLDVDGDPIRNGFIYYVLPAIRGNGGGIERAALGKDTCPITVVQSPNPNSKGLEIKFESAYPAYYINETLILQIKFSYPQQCERKNPWWAIFKDIFEGPPAIKLFGFHGTELGWFKIQKASKSRDFNDYKLVFCQYDETWCLDVGIYVDRQGNRRLVLAVTGEPFLVHFHKISFSTA
uniref:Uncharacterized protein n=1 Tax=Glycine max TaxID=3847 RepID=C6TB67_SOYBN|nr:unknown [Glycine max]